MIIIVRSIFPNSLFLSIFPATAKTDSLMMYKYIVLFLPIIFSTVAQILVKQASVQELKSVSWYLAIGCSLAAYILAFGLYALALRYFAISVASPINTISVMLLVVVSGVVFWGEPFGYRQGSGLLLGGVALLLLLPSE